MRFNLVNYKTWVEIDAQALRYNLAVFEHIAKPARVMAVVKANAYGHGLSEVIKILLTLRSFSEGGWFGVDSIDEALLIRELEINNPVLILGYIPPERLQEAVENDVSFSVYSPEFLRAIIHKRWTKTPRIHIKIETGTNRLGIPHTTLSRLNPHTITIEGVYTHFAETENLSSSFWQKQVARFEEAIALLKEVGIDPIKHTASSAGALLYPETHYDMVRAGIGMYGLWPSKEIESRITNHELRSKKLILKPVLIWKTKIAQIKKISKEETVGYHRTYKAAHDMVIAVLPVGYWDGYDRRLSNKGEVIIRGRRAPVVGNVCMNMAMVDITNITNVRIGDEAVLLGKQKNEEITAEALAEKIGTINYEVVTRINPRIIRRIMNYEA